MANPDKTNYKLVNFFSSFFDNFGKMAVANLLFDIPLVIFGGIIALISYISGTINIFIVFLLIPIMSFVFPGIMYVCRKLTTKDKIRPTKDFFKGLKENLKYSAINGLILYIFALGIWLTFGFYRDNLDNPMIIAAFVISIIFALYFLFMEFLISSMIVTVDLKFIQIIKNSVVLTLAGFVNNIKTLVSLMLVFSVLMTIILMTGNLIVSIVIIGLFVLLFLPIFCAYIIMFNAYPTIDKYVITPYNKEHEAQEVEQKKENMVYETDIDELRELAQANPDEFVFLNGRMLKRSSIQKMLEKRENKSK